MSDGCDVGGGEVAGLRVGVLVGSAAGVSDGFGVGREEVAGLRVGFFVGSAVGTFNGGVGRLVASAVGTFVGGRLLQHSIVTHMAAMHL